ncbi:hypothetical protein P4O66_002585 [Electrophorus voltai]|uniref:Uncharacterized protein n=1 Tax=Electrophorus voltai TaxID=2609070 RepID=A0AAD8YWV4_9TELE|nr:hypothetical protein P4O66_002585 [Electrophorus voltai]
MDISLQSECTDVIFRSDSAIHQVENPAVEVEEALHRDSLSQMNTVSADSESEEPPSPKVPPKPLPRRRRPGISRLPNEACREASSSDVDTPPAKARSPRAQAPTPKPRKDKKAPSPEPAPKMAQSAGAPPDAHAEDGAAAATQAGEADSNPAITWRTGWGSCYLPRTV